MHVADNLEAERRQARRAGRDVAQHPGDKPNRYERRLFDCLPGHDFLNSAIAGAARSTRSARTLRSRHEQAIWDVSSGVTGPLLLAFVTWILREATKLDIRTIYFFSRDGEILLRVAQELQAGLATPIDCRYLHVSRRSLHLPGVTQLGDSEREWVIDNAASNSLEYLLRRLDLEVDELFAVLPVSSPLRLVERCAMMTATDIQAVRDCLELESVRALILRRAEGRRKNCLEYLTREGLLAPGQVAVVDIGWRGRLQRSLCRVISTVDQGYAERLHGFYIDLDRPPTDAGSVSTFKAVCANDFSWARRGSLFEIFCAAGHGTVVRYEVAANGVVGPVLASARNAEALSWGLAVQQEAVVAFCREAVGGLRLEQTDTTEHVPSLATAASEVVRLFVSRPTGSESAAFGSFAHSGDEQHQRSEAIADVIDFWPRALLKRLGPAYRNRRISYWPEASLVRSVPVWMRLPLLAALRALPGRRA